MLGIQIRFKKESASIVIQLHFIKLEDLNLIWVTLNIDET